MPQSCDPRISYSAIDEALTTIKSGRMVIVVDARERENEGDFICAAEMVTPETVDFMLTVGRGVICVPMTQETADRLQLKPAVESASNTAPHQTQFLTQIDHRDAGSGVSSENRAKTIRALSEPDSKHDDFVRPGHISPLLAKEGGVLRRGVRSIPLHQRSHLPKSLEANRRLSSFIEDARTRAQFDSE